MVDNDVKYGLVYLLCEARLVWCEASIQSKFRLGWCTWFV